MHEGDGVYGAGLCWKVGLVEQGGGGVAFYPSVSREETSVVVVRTLQMWRLEHVAKSKGCMLTACGAHSSVRSRPPAGPMYCRWNPPIPCCPAPFATASKV